MIMKIIRNSGFQLLFSLLLLSLALPLTVYVLEKNSFLSSAVSIVVYSIVFMLPVVSYAYLIFGSYQKGKYDMRFIWSCRIIQTTAIFFMFLTFQGIVFGMAMSGVHWTEQTFWRNLVSLTPLLVPFLMFWSITKLKNTFTKRYLWISLGAIVAPLSFIFGSSFLPTDKLLG